MCRILFGQGGLRKGGWAGRDAVGGCAVGEPEGLVLKAQSYTPALSVHRPPPPLEAAPVAIQRMFLWGETMSWFRWMALWLILH